MEKISDIIKKMSIARDDFGYYGMYHDCYAEGGTRAEVINKLLDKAARFDKVARMIRKMPFPAFKIAFKLDKIGLN